MSANNSIEASAETIEAAVQKALDQMGANHDDVAIEVLATPREGAPGEGGQPARVRVTRRPHPEASSGVQSPPAAPALKAPAAANDTQATAHEDEPSGGDRPRADAGPPAHAPSATIEKQGREAAEILGRILELMGEKAQIVRLEADEESIELEIKGDGSGILIGRHGQTLDALEYMVNRILARRVKARPEQGLRDAATITLETESYRARRRQQLHRMALQMGERAKRDHVAVKLEPMPPSDRRVIHLALKDDPMLTTRSEGEGFIRAVEIAPVGQAAAGADRRRSGRSPRQKQPAEAIGEQGGFKHGRKQIV